jgi:TRAP-type mannitol/chloroaromatic compound transport system substrate-binding protein
MVMGAAIIVGVAAAVTFYTMLGRAIERLGQQETQISTLKKQSDLSRETADRATALLVELKAKIAADDAQARALRDHIEAFAKQAAACAVMKRAPSHSAVGRS